MQILNPAKGLILWVRWQDSSLLGEGWVYDEITTRPKEILSVGFIANFSDDAVTLTCAHSDSGGLLSPFTIPFSCIQEYKYFNI